MILVAYWWPQAHIPTLIVYQALKFLKGGRRAPALFFRLELADAIVYKTTTAFNFTFLFMNVGTWTNR